MQNKHNLKNKDNQQRAKPTFNYKPWKEGYSTVTFKFPGFSKPACRLSEGTVPQLQSSMKSWTNQRTKGQETKVLLKGKKKSYFNYKEQKTKNCGLKQMGNKKLAMS